MLKWFIITSNLRKRSSDHVQVITLQPSVGRSRGLALLETKVASVMFTWGVGELE